MSDGLFKVYFSLLVAVNLYYILRPLWISRQKKVPRTLVSRYPISIWEAGAPCGIVDIEGTTVREGDTVILTNQTDSSKNGVWTVNSEEWQRPNTHSHPGSWKINSLGDLWVNITSPFNQWRKISPENGVLPLDSSDFAPNDPIEAAAYLHRLGVPPTHLQGSRTTCINYLVSSGDISRSRGDLLLMKPENLTIDVLLPSGQRVRVLQGWVEQVRTYMTLINEVQWQIQMDYMESIQPTPVVDSKKIDNRPDSPPERRSRYGREPLI